MILTNLTWVVRYAIIEERTMAHKDQLKAGWGSLNPAACSSTILICTDPTQNCLPYGLLGKPIREGHQIALSVASKVQKGHQ